MNPDYRNNPQYGYPDQYYASHQHPAMIAQQPPQAMVIQQQPQMMGGPPVETDVTLLAPPTGGREWSSGICDCTNDVTSCLLTAFFGECYVCYISGKMGEGCCMPWCLVNPLVPMRTKLRTQGHIEGSILEDCCCSTWCAYCVLCQIKREMDFMTGKRNM